MKTVLLECLLVALCGALFGLVANTLSPKGLKLSRNYFPAPAAQSSVQPGETGSVPDHAANSVAQRLALHGFQMVDSNFVAQAFNSPERGQHLVIFVDARDEADYQRGHIPGAYELDYYRPEAYLPTVLPAAMAASRVILYCNGGDCEDSEFAAVLLKDSGVSREKLSVYGGGFAEWSTNNFPVEIGARDSQQMRQ